MGRNSRGEEQFNGCKKQGRDDAVRPVLVSTQLKHYNCSRSQYQPPCRQQA